MRRPVAVVRGLVVAALLAGLSMVAFSPTAAAAQTPTDAVSAAVQSAAAQGVTSFISVVDRGTGQVVAQTANAATQVGSESIMKLFIAAYYLVSYGGPAGTPQSVKDRLSYMLRYSDNAIASQLFSSSIIPTVATRYGMPSTANATDRTGHWGAARITAADMTTFLYAAAHDDLVGPWLIPVMAQTAPTGSADDTGFSQHFGLNALTGEHGSKQGWGCDSFFTATHCAVHSVGYTDRYYVAVLQLSAGGYPDPMRATSTTTAQLIQQSLTDLPIGRLDAVTSEETSVRLHGWAFDPDQRDTPISVAVYIDDVGLGWITTDVMRPDVNAGYGLVGAHGFDIPVTLPFGRHTLAVYGINVGPGTGNPLLSRQTVLVGTAPQGYVDRLIAGPDSTVHAVGWAFDADDAGTSIEVAILVDGAERARTTAAGSRPDVNAALGIGGDHGFDVSVPVDPGSHTVSVRGVEIGSTQDVAIGGARVVVGLAQGHLDSAIPGPGSVTVRGWAFDPDDPAGSISVAVYLDGHGLAWYTADLDRPDVNAVFGISGDHGFAITVPAAVGDHTAAVYAINTGPTFANPLIGTLTAKVTG